ncbi:MAG: hypothetical protein HQK54_02835 [Oligoflexales bacterium]|nr:hypothetical protein [Oligoflexales bacterium]
MRNDLRFACVITAFFLSSSLFAKETEKLYRSAEFLGRGYAGIADPTDEDGIFYNPANLVGSEDEGFRKAVVLSPLFVVSDNLNKLTGASGDDTKMLKAIRDMVGEPVYASVDNFSGFLYNNWGVGMINSGYANFFVYKDPDQGGVEAVTLRAATNNGLAYSYAYPLIEDTLQIGTTVKVISRTVYSADITIADVDAIRDIDIGKYSNSGTGYGLDLAMIYRFPEVFLTPQIGVTIQDIGDTGFSRSKTDGIPVTKLPQTLNLGLAFMPPVPWGVSTVYFDLRDLQGRGDSNFLKRNHLGIDYLWNQLIGVSMGLNQGFYTSGVYLTTKYFRFDIGSYGEEVGDRIGERPSRRYFLRLMSTF